MPPAFYILFGAALTVAVAMALGKLLLRALGLKFHRQEEHLFALVTGSACLSLLVFLLATIGVARKGVFQPLGLGIVAVAVWRGAHRSAGAPLAPLAKFWQRLFYAVFGIFTVLYFFNAMAPEMSPDGSTYHLGLVARYLRNHGFERITTNMYANLSQGIEMLYLFAFSIGRHSAAALVHFAFLVTLPLAMLAYARRFGFVEAGVAGALFTFVSPVVGQDGATAYIDTAVACLLFVLFYLLQIWERERTPRLLIPIGLLAGFCYAAKYTAVVGLLYALGFVGWKQLRARQPAIRPLAVVALCALVMIVPWVAKNWIWLGNPFSPFFNSLFPNPYVHISFEKEYVRHMQNYPGLGSHWEIPLEVTVRGTVLCGLLGPLFLLAPVGLLALRHPAGRQLLLAGGLFLLPYFGNIGTRFLIPAVPFVSLAMALVLVRWKPLAAAFVIAHAVASWPDVVKTYCDRDAWRLAEVPVRQALRIESEESWLTRKSPYYPIARLLDDAAPPGSRILTFSQAPDAYTSREILVAYQSAFNATMGDILWTPLIPEYQPTWQFSFKFPPRPLRKVRVVQTNDGGPDHWSVAELRVFSGEREMPRASRWRLRAHPNPWDVQMAFDNSPVTRWRSWHTLFPGMYVEVDFGRVETIDKVVLECARDQYRIQLKLEAQTPSGEWQALAGEPEEAKLSQPLGLRWAAIDEIKRRGITHLLVYAEDFGADDFRKKAVVWGLTFLGERNRARLYRLD